jgi:hypothetical protein
MEKEEEQKIAQEPRTVAAGVACAPGKYSKIGKLPCIFCPADQFTSRPGATSCSHCAPGRYQPLQGYAFCHKRPCPLGKFETFAGQGLDTIPVCRHGVPCGAGWYSDTGTKPCNQCPLGYVNVQKARGRCSACLVGWTFVSTILPCHRCPRGYYGELTRKHTVALCTSCPRGYYLRIAKAPKAGSRCSACERGRYQHEHASMSCIKCAFGQVGPLLSQTKCTACMPGSYFAITKGCPSGSYCSSCAKCPVGYAQGFAGRASCRNCRQNMYVKGTYQPLNGQRKCFSPKIYWAKKVGGEQRTNAANRSVDWYLAPPEGLHANQYSWSRCPAGRYIDNGLSSSVQRASKCRDCAPGKYQPWPDKLSCLQCPLRLYQEAAGQRSCVRCNTNSGGNSVGTNGHTVGASSRKRACSMMQRSTAPTVAPSNKTYAALIDQLHFRVSHVGPVRLSKRHGNRTNAPLKVVPVPPKTKAPTPLPLPTPCPTPAAYLFRIGGNCAKGQYGLLIQVIHPPPLPHRCTVLPHMPCTV